jgi:hypothetical protein
MSDAIPAKKRRSYALPSPERVAHNAFVAHYRVYCFRVDVEMIRKEFRRQFGRPRADNWQERRKAVLWAACMDLKRVRKTLSGGHARELIAEKYRRVPLGIGTANRKIVLEISGTTLWRVYRLGVHLAGRSPDLLTRKGGRPRKKESL